MVALNLFVCYVITSSVQLPLLENVCRAFIFVMAVPQAIYTVVSTNTAINVIKASPKLTLGNKVLLVLDFRQIGLLLQLISLFQLVCYPISCLLLSLNIKPIKRMWKAAIEQLSLVIRIGNFMVMLLMATILTLEITSSNFRPFDQFLSALMEVVVVIFE